jgi:hypothetical protein
MRRAARSARLRGVKTLIAALLLLAVLPATASAGTIAGKVPRKGKAMTVRVVKLDTAEVVAAKRLTKRRYRVKVPRGRYVVMASAGNRRFTTHAIRAGRRGTRRARLAAAPASPLAVVAVDPNIKLVGADKLGGPKALAIDSMVITDLLQVGCSNGGELAVVEVRHRDLIEKEIELQHGGGFDPDTIVTPHFLTPDTFISGRGEVVGDHITVELTMRGKVNGTSTVSVPIDRPFEMTEGPASALVGQICRSKDEPPAPPAPPVNGPALGYRGSLSGSATITSPTGVITETWSSTDARFSRMYPSTDDAPNYQITEGHLQFSVSGNVGPCTVSGSKSLPIGLDDGDAESTLDLAPDDSYYATGFPNGELDVTYACPDGDPFTVTYYAMNEFLRTNPMVVRRQPSPNGTISGRYSAVNADKALTWTWALRPQL